MIRHNDFVAFVSLWLPLNSYDLTTKYRRSFILGCSVGAAPNQGIVVMQPAYMRYMPQRNEGFCKTFGTVATLIIF